MMRMAVIVAAFLALAVGPGLAHADEDDWVGLYTGVDALDGSVDHLSIVSQADGSFDIRMTSSALGLCSPNPTSGWIVARGRLVDGGLAREEVMYGCAGSDELTPMADGFYSRDGETEILTINGPGGRVNHYHPVHDD